MSHTSGKDWCSCCYSDRHLASQNHWLAQCQYTVTGQDSKFDIQQIWYTSASVWQHLRSTEQICIWRYTFPDAERLSNQETPLLPPPALHPPPQPSPVPLSILLFSWERVSTLHIPVTVQQALRQFITLEQMFLFDWFGHESFVQAEQQACECVISKNFVPTIWKDSECTDSNNDIKGHNARFLQSPHCCQYVCSPVHDIKGHNARFVQSPRCCQYVCSWH